MAAVIRFEHQANSAALLQLIELLNEWLDGKSELRRIFAIWIRAVLLRQSKNAQGEQFDDWAKGHERKGIGKGIEKGDTLLLQRQLVQRFDVLANEVVNQIAMATPEPIETWGDRVLDAATLDDVFCL